MLCHILISFMLARDGFTSEQVLPGGNVEIPDALVAGLLLEGFIDHASEEADDAGVGNDTGAGDVGRAAGETEGTGDGDADGIPDELEGLTWPQMQKAVKERTGIWPKTKAEAAALLKPADA